MLILLSKQPLENHIIAEPILYKEVRLKRRVVWSGSQGKLQSETESSFSKSHGFGNTFSK